MNVFVKAWNGTVSFFNPTNEQKALNALQNFLSVVKTVDVAIDPILALYPPLEAVAKLIDEGIVVIQAAVANLQSVVAAQTTGK
jgi:hypothetical protein